MGHSHGGANDTPARVHARARLLLLLLVVPLLLATVLGLVVLWPADANPPTPDFMGGPAKLADAKIHVLNASGQGGQAAEVAGELRDLGFAEPAATNDTLYANTRLECQGQIRFGPSGRAAAAAAWLVAPCTELFQDQRSDDTVDLAIGTEFGQLTHSDDIDAVLASLRPDATQAADPTLLKKIHTGAC